MTASTAPAPANLWRRFGVNVETARSLDEAIAAAGLNFTVETSDLAYKVPTLGGDFFYRETTAGRAIVRTDTGELFGIVGPSYVPLQNSTAFSVLDPLLDSGIATLVNAGNLRNGRDSFVQVRIARENLGPKAGEFFGTEGIEPLTSVLVNHVGRRAAMFFTTPIRFACGNSIRAAVRGFTADAGVKVRHTKHVESNFVVGAEKTIRSLVKNFETVAGDFAALRHRILTAAEFETLVLDVVAPDPRKSPKFREESRKAESSVARAEARRAELSRLWTEGAGHTGDLSAWEAWNGVVEALDHDVKNLWTSERAESRLVSDLDGAIGQAKTKSYRALLAGV